MSMTRTILFLAVLTAWAHPAAAQLDITHPGDRVQGIPNDQDWPGNEAPYMAIDDNVNTKYLHFKGDDRPSGFQVTPALPATRVVGLTFTTANDAAPRDPIAFELSGSNQGINGPYQLIAAGPIVDFDQPSPWPRYSRNETSIQFENSLPYDHYQLLFTEIREAEQANSMQIAEVEFLGVPAQGLPPQVDVGPDQTLLWRGQGLTQLALFPVIKDDDPCNLSQTDPDYLSKLWSSEGPEDVDFMGTQNQTNARVLFPGPGTYTLHLQVWDEHHQEGRDQTVITVEEPTLPLSDFTGDGRVNMRDWAALADQWLKVSAVSGPANDNTHPTMGVRLNFLDFALFAQQWSHDWTGTLTLTLSPPAAVDAGAQFRVDSGPWLESGTTISNLIPGPHRLEFQSVDDWMTPLAQNIRVRKQQNTTLTVPYLPQPEGTLLITEVMASNHSTAKTRVQQRDVFSDWIEITNFGTEPINLQGWHLTDDMDDPNQWPCPDVTLLPNQVWLVYASNIRLSASPEKAPYQDDMGRYHTNFSLARAGDTIALFQPNGVVAHVYANHALDSDSWGYPPQYRDVSYGLYGNQFQYFHQPTPGKVNTAGFATLHEEPQFSRRGGTFTESFLLTLLPDDPSAEVHYTLDGRIPSVNSPRYTHPVWIDRSTEVLARTFYSGKGPSPIGSHTYLRLDPELASFSSNLPIVVIDTQGQSLTTTFRPTATVVMDIQADGRTSILGPIDYAGRGGLKKRGRSTLGSPKPSYGFELWDAENIDQDEPLLGMPAESDWVLYAPYSFDRVLINNALMFELSNRLGRYAVRTRFVEMFVNTQGREQVVASDYVGLYIMMEKIKRGPARVDVEELHPWDNTEATLSGGYMLKIDRPDSGDRGFRTARGNPIYGDGTLCYVTPKESDITQAQSAWIRGYLDTFEDALYGPDFADPWLGYARYIDVASFQDHNLLNMLAMNVDALRLSTHLHKTRDGRLEMGPLWDFDRSLNSADGRDDNPERWHGSGDGTDYLQYVWWNRLFEDGEFWQQYIDRWSALREQIFSEAKLFALIDTMALEITEAQQRNEQRWPGAKPRYGSFANEIQRLQDWLSRRLLWVDEQFVHPPTLSHTERYLPPGQSLALINPQATGSIFYTLDGSDPRLSSSTALEHGQAPGTPAPTAILYQGQPLTFAITTVVKARVFSANNSISPWSGLKSTTFFVNPWAANLRITEVMYHPPAADPSQNELDTDPDDFEFVELKNMGGQPLPLTDLSLDNGVEFDFSQSPIKVLPPGQTLLIVKNRAAFTSRYGDTTLSRIAGEFQGKLSNSGEPLALYHQQEGLVAEIYFDDRWYSQTDGNGSSLVLKDARAHAPETWNTADAWAPSQSFGGTPGTH